jgi:hypothetical protein
MQTKGDTSVLSAWAKIIADLPDPLDSSDLANVLKYPNCTGHVRSAVLGRLAKVLQIPWQPTDSTWRTISHPKLTPDVDRPLVAPPGLADQMRVGPLRPLSCVSCFSWLNPYPLRSRPIRAEPGGLIIFVSAKFVFRMPCRFYHADRLRELCAFEEGRRTRTAAPCRCAVCSVPKAHRIFFRHQAKDLRQIRAPPDLTT